MERLASEGIDVDSASAVGESTEERTKKLVQEKYQLTSAVRKRHRLFSHFRCHSTKYSCLCLRCCS